MVVVMVMDDCGGREGGREGGMEAADGGSVGR